MIRVESQFATDFDHSNLQTAVLARPHAMLYHPGDGSKPVKLLGTVDQEDKLLSVLGYREDVLFQSLQSVFQRLDLGSRGGRNRIPTPLCLGFQLGPPVDDRGMELDVVPGGEEQAFALGEAEAWLRLSLGILVGERKVAFTCFEAFQHGSDVPQDIT